MLLLMILLWHDKVRYTATALALVVLLLLFYDYYLKSGIGAEGRTCPPSKLVDTSSHHGLILSQLLFDCLLRRLRHLLLWQS